jgi:hypothetical protein
MGPLAALFQLDLHHHVETRSKHAWVRIKGKAPSTRWGFVGEMLMDLHLASPIVAPCKRGSIPNEPNLEPMQLGFPVKHHPSALGMEPNRQRFLKIHLSELVSCSEQVLLHFFFFEKYITLTFKYMDARAHRNFDSFSLKVEAAFLLFCTIHLPRRKMLRDLSLLL